MVKLWIEEFGNPAKDSPLQKLAFRWNIQNAVSCIDSLLFGKSICVMPRGTPAQGVKIGLAHYVIHT